MDTVTMCSFITLVMAGTLLAAGFVSLAYAIARGHRAWRSAGDPPDRVTGPGAQEERPARDGADRRERPRSPQDRGHLPPRPPTGRPGPCARPVESRRTLQR
ncbi:hypothetical protein ITP53_40425 [Nonomuraea sp. K274]|uniref:Uncharacterized protein n=1 Tax=Nonomuraea cypriaca TaxID=1187855 RepID=A0A931F596_9ACTN|nr:hypothetical protein [Nonomuraea cypriaca]MBF8191843.1 hypothetical protein [Nonomuraea cypriaca]